MCNKLFYQGRITDAECTKLVNRPKARDAINWIRETYQVDDGIPHICLHVEDGVMLQDQFHSRYNLHNFVAAIHAILKMLADGLWTESQISVLTPYRRQAAIYHFILGLLKLFGVKVFIVDVMQGFENQCTIFDTVLAFNRAGSYGHITSGFRLNVALSRSINMFIILIDRKALDLSEYREKKREAIDKEMRMDDIKREQETIKHLSKVCPGLSWAVSGSIKGDSVSRFERSRHFNRIECVLYGTCRSLGSFLNETITGRMDIRDNGLALGKITSDQLSSSMACGFRRIPFDRTVLRDAGSLAGFCSCKSSDISKIV